MRISEGKKGITNKILAIVLAAVVMTGLAGCSSAKPSGSKNENTSKPVVINLTVDGKSFIQSVETVDAKTVRFKVEKPR